MWLESNLKWTDFMPADKVDIFLEKEGLDWMQVGFIFVSCLNESNNLCVPYIIFNYIIFKN